MTKIRLSTSPRRAAAAVLLALAAGSMAGCSNDFASFEDNYVPQTVEENFPIRVADRPQRLTIDVAYNGLQAGDTDEVARFARSAERDAASPVSITYPSGSKSARRAAEQAAAVMARNGVARSAISISHYDGASNVITLAYSSKVAVTKPCGTWSENLRTSYTNDDVGSNFGCAYQQNFAAMVANPEDFERAREMPRWHYYTTKPAPPTSAGTGSENGSSSSGSGSPSPGGSQ